MQPLTSTRDRSTSTRLLLNSSLLGQVGLEEGSGVRVSCLSLIMSLGRLLGVDKGERLLFTLTEEDPEACFIVWDLSVR